MKSSWPICHTDLCTVTWEFQVYCNGSVASQQRGDMMRQGTWYVCYAETLFSKADTH